ncbi:hypothetical protein [Peterkaempfera sp. SMS 1(5)a]|uniref:hypothetical protein n=1 Tax=Peterkaempfera podocarpi TaxID=3232308 RepID=UPI003672C817
MKRSVRTAICSAVISLALAAPVPAAHALDGEPELLQVAYVIGDPQTLALEAEANSPITHVTAHFFPKGALQDAPEVYETDDFVQDGTQGPSRSFWHNAHPLLLPAFGHYRVTFDLTDADGDQTYGLWDAESFGGYFWYAGNARIEDFQATPTHPDYDHRTLTLTGRLTTSLPGHPEQRTPLADTPVDVVGSEVTTDEDGRFSRVLPVNSRFVDVSACAWASEDHYVACYQDPDIVSTALAPTRIQLSTAASATLDRGATVTYRGTAQVLTAAGWKALPAARVTLDIPPAARNGIPETLATATSDSHGAFALSTTPIASGHAVIAVDAEDAPFYGDSPHVPVSYTVVVRPRISVTGFSAKLDPRSRLTATTQLRAPAASVNTRVPAVLERSADGRTGWQTVKNLTVDLSHGSARLTTTVDKAPSASYWRVRLPGTPQLLGTGTDSLWVHRWPTRFAGLNASPEPVRAGGYVTVSGTLQRQSAAGWIPVSARQTVYIGFRRAGSSTTTWVGWVTTDSHGHFSTRIRDYHDGYWTARWLTDNPYFLQTVSAADYVDVR